MITKQKVFLIDSPDDSAEKEVDDKFSDLANKETEEKKVGKQLTGTEKAILRISVHKRLISVLT